MLTACSRCYLPGQFAHQSPEVGSPAGVGSDAINLVLPVFICNQHAEVSEYLSLVVRLEQVTTVVNILCLRFRFSSKGGLSLVKFRWQVFIFAQLYLGLHNMLKGILANEQKHKC